jgi:hypothetical protein
MSLRTRDIFSSLTMSNSSSLLLKYSVVSEQKLCKEEKKSQEAPSLGASTSLSMVL